MAEKTPHTFDFQPDEDGTLTLESAVFQALGAASTCWSNIADSGEFQSERAQEIGDKLLRRITGTAELASAESPKSTVRTATVHLVDGQEIHSDPKVLTPGDLEQMEGSTDRIGQVVGSSDGYVHLELGEGTQAVIPSRNISWLEFQDAPEGVPGV